MRMRKQSGVRQILKVCKEHSRVSAVNTRSQNSVKNNRLGHDVSNDAKLPE